MTDGAEAADRPRLRVRGLRVALPGRGGAKGRSGLVPIVRGVDLDIAAGETLAVVGASGSGKTTLGRAILRLVPATGSVRLGDDEVLLARGAELRRMRARLQMVWQDPAGSLDPTMPVGEQVAEPLYAGAGAAAAAASPAHLRIRRREALGRATELLERCGLPADAPHRRPAAFSGGQQQRIAIARALITDPDVLVCDEPTSALDAAVRGSILALLGDLQRERGLSILLITHDLAVVEQVAQRTAVMDAGCLVETGPTSGIIGGGGTAPATRALLAARPARHPRETAERRAVPVAAAASLSSST